MNVCLIAQQSIAMVAGGPLVQVRQTARFLPEFDVTVSMFDQWNPPTRDSVDLVHLFGASHLTFDIARRLHQFGIPYVVTPIFYARRSGRSIRIARSLTKLLGGIGQGIRTDFDFTESVCRDARLVIPNTSEEAAIIHSGFDIEDHAIMVVPNGVEERFAHSTPDEFVGRYGLRDFVLNVGHIGSERKNVLRLIESMEGIDRDLVLIGKVQKSEYADRCLEAARRHGRTTIIEGLDHDSSMLESAYAACQVFALPSQYETPGIAALEAGVAGAKIVITPNGGAREYFVDQAEYIDPASTESIRRGIRNALDRTSNKDTSRSLLERYSWRSVAEKTAEAYRRALSH